MHSFIFPIVFTLALQLCCAVGQHQGPTLAPPSTFDSATGSASGSAASATASSTLSVSSTASAEFPSLSGFSACVTNCLQLAVSESQNCTSVVDVNCYCTSNTFADNIVDCTASNCPDEIETLESLAQRFCNLASRSTSLSFHSLTASSSAPTNTAPSTTTGTTITTTSGSEQTSNAASLAKAGSGSSKFFAVSVVVLWVVFGAYLVE